MKQSRSNLVILFFLMVVVMIGFGLIIPIMPFYVESMGADAKQLGLLMAVFSIMQFLFAPMWGSISDRIGRKPVLLLGALGNALTQVLMGFSTEYWMLFAARALAGVLSSATLPTAMAYISDSTDDKQRSGGMGIVGAAMGVGMVLGPGLGGWLAGHSLSTPFFLAGGLSMVAVVLIAIFLPESLSKQAREQFAHSRIRGPQIKMMWRELWGPLGFLLFLAFLINFALANFEGIFGLYAARRFGYGPGDVGSIMTVIGLASALVQGLATGPVTARFGEGRVIKVSLIASAVGFVLMLLAKDYITVMLTVGLFVTANAMLRPAIASVTSKQTVGGQGMAMGLNNAYQSLGRTVGPLWAGFMFDINLSLPYLTAALILFGTYLASLRVAQERLDPGVKEPVPASMD
jgi:DHA1 family multidrug resistance protein-like MFS transporter